MEVAHKLISGQRSSRLRDRRRYGTIDSGITCTPSRVTTSSSGGALHEGKMVDYDSNLRRRRLSIKGTERLKQFTRMDKPPVAAPHENRFLYCLGRVAGVAWGGITLSQFFKEFWPSYNPNKSTLLNLGIHLAGFLITVMFSLGSALLFLVGMILYAIDELHILIFWCRSIYESFQLFVIKSKKEKEACVVKGESVGTEKEKIIAKILRACSTIDPDDKENVERDPTTSDRPLTTDEETIPEYTIFQNDLRPTILWRGCNWFNDLLFVGYFYVLSLIFCVLPELFVSRTITQPRKLDDFRVFLSLHSPPITPVSANDTMYKFDDEHSRFQLTMLFVIDRMTFSEFREAYIRRWITWEPKTRSVLTRWCGRWAWKTLDYNHFDVNNHIKHIKGIDFSKKSIAEIISELSTCDLPETLPQWEVWFIDGAADDCVFVASKWNHAYADGVGMMASIVSRLGDEPVSTTTLPEHYKREIPKWQQRLYYAYHGIFAATECLQFLLYSCFGTKLYQGLFSGSGYVSLRSTGVKHYSTPMLVKKSELQDLCLKIQSAAVETYVKKVIHSSNANQKIPPVPGKPTINDLLCYCLTNAISQLKCESRAKYLLSQLVGLEAAEPHWHNPDGSQHISTSAYGTPKHAPGSTPPDDGVNIIIPMMCRTSLPECMDNFTSLVPTTLPLNSHGIWRCCDQVDSLDLLVNGVYEVKSRLDQVKRQNCRVALFLVFYGICKALPYSWARYIHGRAYCNMQFCSTNVAAPSIEARFCNKQVHGLFFWPAVSSGSTCGSSWISLGDDIHVNTVLDETELRRGVEHVNQALQEKSMPLLTENELTCLLADIGDIIPNLIQDELDRIKSIFS